MSLAQRTEHSVEDLLERAAPAAALPVGGRVLNSIEFRQLARRPPPASLAYKPTVVVPVAAPVAPPQTSRSALDLLAEVSEALPAVLARCRSLEAALATSRDKGRQDLEAANEVIREWQGIADTMRVQLETAEKDKATLLGRVEAADAELATVRDDVERAQHAAAEAECLSSLFEEKVMAAFGVGSPGHSIMESVRNRTQQMLSA